MNSQKPGLFNHQDAAAQKLNDVVAFIKRILGPFQEDVKITASHESIRMELSMDLGNVFKSIFSANVLFFVGIYGRFETSVELVAPEQKAIEERSKEFVKFAKADIDKFKTEIARCNKELVELDLKHPEQQNKELSLVEQITIHPGHSMRRQHKLRFERIPGAHKSIEFLEKAIDKYNRAVQSQVQSASTL